MLSQISLGCLGHPSEIWGNDISGNHNWVRRLFSYAFLCSIFLIFTRKLFVLINTTFFPTSLSFWYWNVCPNSISIYWIFQQKIKFTPFKYCSCGYLDLDVSLNWVWTNFYAWDWLDEIFTLTNLFISKSHDFVSFTQQRNDQDIPHRQECWFFSGIRTGLISNKTYHCDSNEHVPPCHLYRHSETAIHKTESFGFHGKIRRSPR